MSDLIKCNTCGMYNNITCVLCKSVSCFCGMDLLHGDEDSWHDYWVCNTCCTIVLSSWNNAIEDQEKKIEKAEKELMRLRSRRGAFIEKQMRKSS